MKSILTILLVAMTALVCAIHGPAAAALVLFVGGNALIMPSDITAGILRVELTPTVLLQQTMRKIFVKVPALRFFSSEFTTERVKLNQKVIGKIRVRPVVSEYDKENGGYKAGAQEGKELLRDVEFVMDKHMHVTVSLAHLNAIQDSIIKTTEHIEDSASVLGAEICRYMLGTVKSSAFSNATEFASANANKDMLTKVRKKMNKRGVPDSRFMLVNSDVSEAIDIDSRVSNRPNDGSKTNEENAYMNWKALAGFRDIQEDPGLSDGNAEAVDFTAEADDDVLTTAAAHGYKVNDRVKITALTGGTGLAEDEYYFVQSVPSTTTLTLSATRGGAKIDVTSDGTGGELVGGEDIIAFAATREAIAIKTALPSDSIALARAIGITPQVSDEVITDPDSGISMILYQWFEQGTMDAYVTVACLYGATAGALCDTEGHVMEPCGEIIREAA